MITPVAGPGEVVIGVVVTVPQPHADVLAEARRESGDPEGHTLAPHVTLVGPVAVARADLGAVDEHLAHAVGRHAPFDVHLRGTGTFRPVSPVVFATVTRGIADCEQLERVIRSGPLHHRLRFPYHPHVTVAQGVGDEALDAAMQQLADFEAVFHVSSIDRYELDDDGVWRPVRAFAIGG